jgi:hypothetical protein
MPADGASASSARARPDPGVCGAPKLGGLVPHRHKSTNRCIHPLPDVEPPAEWLDRSPASFRAFHARAWTLRREVLARSHFPRGLLPSAASTTRQLWTMALALSVLRAGLPGDFVETGVYTGGSTILMMHLLDAEREARLVWACDSFKGLPRPDAKDFDPTCHSRKDAKEVRKSGSASDRDQLEREACTAGRKGTCVGAGALERPGWCRSDTSMRRSGASQGRWRTCACSRTRSGCRCRSSLADARLDCWRCR